MVVVLLQQPGSGRVASGIHSVQRQRATLCRHPSLQHSLARATEACISRRSIYRDKYVIVTTADGEVLRWESGVNHVLCILSIYIYIYIIY
jgi:hypothetical protein